MIVQTAIGRVWPAVRALRRSNQGAAPPTTPAQRNEAKRRISVLAAIAYIPLLLSRPGTVLFDTADAPFVDPNRAMRLAVSRWNPTTSLGTVADRALDDGFPMTPWFWLGHQLHAPTWIVQRLWLGTLLLVAGLGVFSMMKALRWIGPGRLGAAVAYMASPYLMSGLGGRSVMFLAWAALPWLIADTIRSLETSSWQYPARFGLVIAIVARTHLPSLIYVLVGPLLWVLSSVLGTREVPWTQARRAVARMLFVSLAGSAWWLIALASDPRVALEDLRAANAVDAARDVAIVDVVRSVVDPSDNTGGYGLNAALIVVTYLVPAIALTALCKVRFRNRLYVVALIVVGVVLSAGSSPRGHPQPLGRLLEWIVRSDPGALLAPSVRAIPLVSLGMAIGLGAATRALTQFRRARPAVVETGAVVLALATVPTLLVGQILDGGLRHEKPIPLHWREFAATLEDTDAQYNLLELPGVEDTDYSWGSTNSPIAGSLMNRAVAFRTTDPPSEVGTHDVVASIDAHLRAGTLKPSAIAPLARMLAIDTIVVRNDRPGDLDLAQKILALLESAPGIEPGRAYGPADGTPPLTKFIVSQPLPRVRLADASDLVIVAGNGAGIVELANAGLLDGSEVIVFAAAFKDVAELAELVQPQTRFILTDSNRWQLQSVETFTDEISATGGADWPLPSFDGARWLNSVNDAKPGSFTVVDFDGVDTLVAADVRGVTSHRPQDRAALAFDGDENTAWRFGRPTRNVGGARVTLRFADPIEANELTISQPDDAPAIRRVALTFDGFRRVDVDIAAGDSSGTQPSPFEPQRFRTVTIEAIEIDPASPGDDRPGFAELTFAGQSIDERLVLPGDLFRLNGAIPRSPLTIALTRWRDPEGNDPETHIARSFVIPEAKLFTVSGTVRTVGDTPPKTGCRTDLISVGEQLIDVRLTPSQSEPDVFELSACDGELRLDTGSHTLRTAPVGSRDVVIDQLILAEQAPSGERLTNPPVFAIEDPEITSFDGGLRNAAGDYWLVNSVSADEGWTAEVDQVPLSGAQLVNGYATGWPMSIGDANRHVVSVRMSSQRTINIAVIVSASATIIAAALGLRRSNDPRRLSEVPPDSLRAVNSSFVVLAALGVFSIAAGPLPGLAAGLAALGMEHRAALQRTVGWIPLPVMVGIGLTRGAHESFADSSTANWWGADATWSNGLAWVSIAVAVTTALVNSERRPARQLIV